MIRGEFPSFLLFFMYRPTSSRLSRWTGSRSRMSTAGHVKLMRFLNLRSSPINGGNATRRGGPTPDRPTSSRLSYWTGSRSRMSTAGHVKLVPPLQLTTLLVDRLSISNEHCRSCELMGFLNWRSSPINGGNAINMAVRSGPSAKAHDSLNGQALVLE